MVTALLGGYWAAPASSQAQGDGLAQQQKSEDAVVGDGSVSGVVVSSDVSGSLSVSWDAASPVPSDYRVSWAPSDEDYLTWTDLSGNAFPTANSLEITGLDPARTYKVRVRARYRTGQWANARWAGDWAASAFGVPDGSGALPVEPAGTVLAGRLVLGSGSSGGDTVVGYSRANAGTGSFDARYWDSVVFWHHVGLFSVSQIKGTPSRGPAANLDNPVVLSGTLLMGNVTPFLLEVDGRTLSSEHAVAPEGQRAHGARFDYWIWDNPCVDWQTADEPYLRIIKTDESDPRLDHTDATLGSLSVTGAVLDTVFDPTSTEHTATAGADTAQVTIDVTAADANACAVEIVPADADPDAAGHQIDLGDAGAVAVISVTAADNATTSSHTLTIGRGDAQPAAVADARLDDIEVEFDPNQQRYEADIPPGTTQTTLELTPAGDSMVDGYVFNPGNSGLDPVADGGTVPLQRNRETLIAVKVSAPDNSQQDYYTIRLQPPPSSPPPATPASQDSQRDTTIKLTAPSAATGAGLHHAAADVDAFAERFQAVSVGNSPRHGTSPRVVPAQGVPRNSPRNNAEPELSALSVSPGTLAPAFAADKHRYTASVGADIDKITVAATAVSGATAVIAAPDAEPSTPGHQVALNASTTGGPATQTAILIVVTAGTKIDSYVLVVTRAAPPNTDATLSSLTISSGTLSPAFASATTAYTATVANTVTAITITTATTDSGATIETLPADSDDMTAGHQISLGVGPNTITTTVTAADDTTTSTYTTTVTRTGASTDATLKSLTLSPGTLDPTFAAATLTYTASVPHATEQITIAAAPTNDGATVVISPPDADPDTAGHQAGLHDPAGLEPAVTPIVVTVTAADTTTRKTYIVNVARAGPAEALTFQLPAGCVLQDLDGTGENPWRQFNDDCASLYLTSPQRAAQYYRLVLSAEGKVHLSTRRHSHQTATHLIIRSTNGTILAKDSPPPDNPDYYPPELTHTLPAGTYVIEAAAHFFRHYNRSHRLRYSGPTIVLPADHKLAGLQIDGANMAGFHSDTHSYRRNVAADVDTVTVRPIASIPYSEVAIEPADTDTSTPAHEVDLEADGTTEITVTVRKPAIGDDGTPEKSTTYTITLTELPGTTSPLSDDATLQSLTFDNIEIGTFDADDTEYTYTLGFYELLDGLTTTMAYQAASSEATIVTNLPDADPIANGHQIELDGDDTITVTVTSQDNANQRTYRVSPTRVVVNDAAKTWKIDCIEDRPYGNYRQYSMGLWSNGEKITALIDTVATLCTYNPQTRQAEENIALEIPRDRPDEQCEPCAFPHYFWSDGTTFWVLYNSRYTEVGDTFYAYSMDTKQRLPDKDIDPGERFRSMWSDGHDWYATLRSYVWRLDLAGGNHTRLFRAAPGYHQINAIWSDGQTMWLSSGCSPYCISQVRAYDIETGARRPGLDIPTYDSVYARFVTGLWSDGHTMWVATGNSHTRPIALYAFTLPESARLKSLSVSDGDIGVFRGGVFDYSVEVPASTTTTTVEAAAAFSGGSSAVAFDTADTDSNTPGHQVTLDSANPTTVTITVTAPNGTDTDTYTVTITVAAP